MNVGATDRQFRTALGAVLGVASLTILTGTVSAASLLSPLLGVVSLIMLGTAVTGLCPIYSALGLSTNSAESERRGSRTGTNR